MGTLFYAGKNLREYPWEFVKRMTAAYVVTLLALKRAAIIALPASLAATAVDYAR